MNKLLSYKGYLGSIEFSIEDELFFGKLEGIRSLVAFKAENSKELIKVFYEAVDDYLDTCKELNIEPEIPCNGDINIKIGRELHLDAVKAAIALEENTDKFVEEAIKEKVEKIKREKCVA